MGKTPYRVGSGARGHAPLIHARNITYRIDEAVILREIGLTLRPGEVVGLIGPNGAGKSTLLKVLGGLWRGAEGVIQVEGRPLAGYAPRDLARLIAHVPQAAPLDFAFTVREVVLMGRSPHLGRFQLERDFDRAIADEAMRQADVIQFADRFVNTLSGGEQQRVFIARALTQQPRVLLLDEPTANLDVKHQLGVLALVRRLAHERGIGVIAAIHDLGLAARFCDRLTLLHEGRILADDTPAAVLTPRNLEAVFEVQARVYADPFTQELCLSLAHAPNGSNGRQAKAEAVPFRSAP